MANFKPLYTNSGQVKLYLRKKALFNVNRNGSDALTTQEINKFIVDAEARVEIDLSKQYVIPFSNEDGGAFSTLPQNSQVMIQNLATWKTVLLILQVYWGDSEGVRGTTFVEYCIEQYNSLLKEAKGLDDHGQYLTTPLLSVKLNPNASYRTQSGAQSPISAVVGGTACDDSSRTRRKLTNLNKNFWYGFNRRGY